MSPHWGWWASRMQRGTVGDDTQTGLTFWDRGANADVQLNLIVQAVDEENKPRLCGNVSSLLRTSSLQPPFCPNNPALPSADGALNSAPTNLRRAESNMQIQARARSDDLVVLLRSFSSTAASVTSHAWSCSAGKDLCPHHAEIRPQLQKLIN